MAREILNPNSTQPNDKLGDTPWDYTGKLNRMTDELYSSVLNNVVVINSVDDFPDQTDTTITLKSQTKYVVGSPITTGKKFIAEDSSSIGGASQGIVAITYTGGDAMFNPQGNFIVNQLAFICASSKIVETSSTGSFVIFNSCACVLCLQIAEVSSSNLIFYDSIIVECSVGMVFSGPNCQLITSGTRFETTTNTNIFVNLGTAVFDVLRITTTEFFGVPGAVCISGLGKDNMISGGRAVVDVSGLSAGGLVPISGFDSNAVRWQFSGCTGVSNSQDAGDLFLENGPETIAVSVIGDFYEVGLPVGGANWNSDIEHRFEFSPDGFLTYIGEREIDATVMATATVHKAGGGSDVVEMRIATNWSAGQSGLVKSTSQTQNAQPTSITSIALVKLQPGDTIRLIFANNSSTGDIIVEVTSLAVAG